MGFLLALRACFVKAERKGREGFAKDAKVLWAERNLYLRYEFGFGNVACAAEPR